MTSSRSPSPPPPNFQPASPSHLLPNSSSSIDLSHPPCLIIEIDDTTYFAFSSLGSNDAEQTELLFTDQPHLFRKTLWTFVHQLQASFNTVDDLTLHFPELNLDFPMYMVYSQKVSLMHLYLLTLGLRKHRKNDSIPFRVKVIRQKFSFIDQYNFLLSITKESEEPINKTIVSNNNISSPTSSFTKTETQDNHNHNQVENSEDPIVIESDDEEAEEQKIEEQNEKVEIISTTKTTDQEVISEPTTETVFSSSSPSSSSSFPPKVVAVIDNEDDDEEVVEEVEEVIDEQNEEDDDVQIIDGPSSNHNHTTFNKETSTSVVTGNEEVVDVDEDEEQEEEQEEQEVQEEAQVIVIDDEQDKQRKQDKQDKQDVEEIDFVEEKENTDLNEVEVNEVIDLDNDEKEDPSITTPTTTTSSTSSTEQNGNSEKLEGVLPTLVHITNGDFSSNTEGKRTRQTFEEETEYHEVNGDEDEIIEEEEEEVEELPSKKVRYNDTEIVTAQPEEIVILDVL